MGFLEKTSKIHPALVKLLFIAFAVISGAFTIIPSAFASTPIYQDDYTINSGWTQVGNTVTVDSSSFPDRVHFEKTYGGCCFNDQRVYKQLAAPLPVDGWILEFDYVYSFSQMAGHMPVTLTETSGPSQNAGTTDHIILFHGLSQNNLMLWTSGGVQNYGDGIDIAPNTKHYVKVERTQTKLALSIFSDPGRTIHIPGSPVSLNITASDFDNLNYIQHSNSILAGPARILTGDVDNTKIFTHPITIQVPPVNTTITEPPVNNTTTEPPVNNTTTEPPVNNTTTEPSKTNNTTTIQPQDIESNNEAKIITDKPVYRQVNKDVNPSNKIKISGNFPENMILCQNAGCESGGVIPYLEAFTPDNISRMRSSIYDSMDLSSNTFEIQWSVPVELGTWTLKLGIGIGNGKVDEIARCTFLVSQSGDEDIGFCGEQSNTSTIDEEPDVIEVIEVIDEDDASNIIQICHIPQGNLDNPQTIQIPEVAWKEHEMHGDSIGECNLNIGEIKSSNTTSPDLTSILEVDSIITNNVDKKIKTQKEIDKKLEKQLKKEILIKEQKHQREKSMKKSELASYRDEFYKIKNELKLFKENGENTEGLKSKLQSIISDFQKTINILKNDYEFDDEYKTGIKTELTEKIKEKNEKMTTTERNFYSKVSSKLSELSKSNEPIKTANDLGLQYKNGKTTVTITLSSVNQKVIDNLESIGKVNGVSGKHIQLTIDLKKLKDIESVPGVELITPAFSAIPS